MSMLTPLYILGLSAIVAPIVFHLIRRSPRGEVPFSSLMFLSPTPPRLTRRSRLENWLLLLLRAAALSLLAFAFARPFLRQSVLLDSGEVERRRIVVLVDTSASMRRGQLWKQGKALAGEAIDGCKPTDQLALFSFDAASRPLMGFEESATLDPSRRRAVARGLLDGISPTWGATNLGQALIDAVAAIEDVGDASEKSGRMPRQIVLISDLQQGSRLDVLGDFEWPSDVTLELKTVADNGSNAGLHGLPGLAEADPARAVAERRVQVSNDAGSRQDKFEISWVDDKGAVSGKPIEVYVPAAESRVVRIPRPARSTARQSLRLKGDGHDFDNALFFVDERPRESTVVYLGADRGDDPAGLLYYLKRVFIDTLDRSVVIRVSPLTESMAWDSEHNPSLVVVTTDKTTAENVSRLRDYIRGGGTVLYVVTTPGPAGILATLADVAPWDVVDGTVRRDVMLGEIAFDHPLFAPLAAAQFNDFTKIHFWKYRRIDNESLGKGRVLARFESGDAAMIEKAVGKGRIIVLASGWQPADSELARSSKFVPLMSGMLEGRDARPLAAASYLVHNRVPMPVVESAGSWGSGIGDRGTLPHPTQLPTPNSLPKAAAGLAVHKPDGTVVTVPPAAPFFADTDQPGVFTIDTPAGARSFAVNLDPSESKTSPLHLETLEQFGCRLAKHLPKKVDEEQLRQMYSAELENRQKLWRWLILAAIGVLIVETWLAGASRSS